MEPTSITIFVPLDRLHEPDVANGLAELVRTLGLDAELSASELGEFLAKLPDNLTRLQSLKAVRQPLARGMAAVGVPQRPRRATLAAQRSQQRRRRTLSRLARV